MNKHPYLSEEDFRKFKIGAMGSKVLIGLREVFADGTETMQQFWGFVTSVDINDGIVVENPNGDEWKLPPAPDWFVVAKPETYRLRSTGQEVRDPDYLVEYRIDEPNS